MGPLLIFLICLPHYVHGVQVILTNKNVQYLSDTYDVREAEYVAYDEVNNIAYVSGGPKLHVLEVDPAEGTMVLLKTKLYDVANLGQVRHCGNYISLAWKPVADKAGVGLISILNIYDKETGDGLEVVQVLDLGGSPGSHRLYDSCKKFIVPIVNKEKSDGDSPGLIEIHSFDSDDLSTAKVTKVTLDFDFSEEAPRLRSEGGLLSPSVDFSTGLQPNNLCINEDETFAYVIMQDNNIVVTVNLATNTIVLMKGLGLKDFSKTGLDAFSKDGPNIQKYPIFGAYGPSSIQCFTAGGSNYFVVANDGGVPYKELSTIKSAKLDPFVFSSKTFQRTRFAGRLKYWSNSPANENGVTQLIVPGGRSISVFNADTSTMVNDTGSLIEERISTEYPSLFNANSRKPGDSIRATTDSRSVNRGPEPHAIAGFIACRSRYYVVIVGMEQPGGLMYFTLDMGDIEAGFEYQGLQMDVDNSDTSKSWFDLWGTGNAYSLQVSDMALNSERTSILLVTGKNGNTLASYTVRVKCNA